MLSSIAIDSPVGGLTITATADAIVAIGWDRSAGGEADAAARRGGAPARRLFRTAG